MALSIRRFRFSYCYLQFHVRTTHDYRVFLWLSAMMNRLLRSSSFFFSQLYKNGNSWVIDACLYSLRFSYLYIVFSSRECVCVISLSPLGMKCYSSRCFIYSSVRRGPTEWAWTGFSNFVYGCDLRTVPVLTAEHWQIL